MYGEETCQGWKQETFMKVKCEMTVACTRMVAMKVRSDWSRVHGKG